MGSPFLPNLRFQNLFGIPDNTGLPNPSTGFGTYTGQPMAPENPLEAYKPDTQAQEMLYRMLGEMPQRREPGILRKIAGSLINLGGDPNATEDALYGPYRRQMTDWQMKWKPTLDVANQERASNVNLRQIATSAAANAAAQRRLDIQAGESERKAREGQQNIAIREKRAATYDWKARNPNHTVKTDSEGRLIGIDPQTNESQFITGPDGQPVRSNELSDEDKINLQLGASLKRIAATGAEARKTEAVRQSGRETLVNMRARIRKEAATKDKTMSASQEAAAWKLARQQYITDNPQHRDFWDETGLPTSDAEDDDEYADAVDDIRERYNRIKSRATGRANPNTAPNNTGTPPPVEKRTKGMKWKFPNGNEGQWDGTKWVPTTTIVTR
jgi:hypothetical protein